MELMYLCLAHVEYITGYNGKRIIKNMLYVYDDIKLHQIKKVPIIRSLGYIVTCLFILGNGAEY